MIAEMKRISIAESFNSAPGSRNVDEGSYSGEEFLNRILQPAFEEVLKSNSKLLVDLDNTEGYATSFLEEAFGGLARKHGAKVVLKTLEFKSDDEPLLIEEIKSYIEDANQKK